MEKDTCSSFELKHFIEAEDGSPLPVDEIEKFHDEVIALIEARGWRTIGSVWLKRGPWKSKDLFSSAPDPVGDQT